MKRKAKALAWHSTRLIDLETTAAALRRVRLHLALSSEATQELDHAQLEIDAHIENLATEEAR